MKISSLIILLKEKKSILKCKIATTIDWQKKGTNTVQTKRQKLGQKWLNLLKNGG